MRIGGLDLLFLEVNSIEESLAFYHDVLGFDINKHSPDSSRRWRRSCAGELKITLAQHLGDDAETRSRG